MSKRPGSLVLTFSKKNTDIRKLLDGKKANDENFITTEYICDAIRFYEKHRDAVEFNNMAAVKKLIDERLSQFIQANNTVTLPLASSNKSTEEKNIINKLKTNISTLESDLDDIPIDED